MTGQRKWTLRVGLGLAVAIAVGGTWAGLNATELRARYAARQLRTATGDVDRTKAADRLLALGDPGLTRLIDSVSAGEESARTAAASAIGRHVADLADGEPRAIFVAGRVLDAFPGANDGGRRAVLELLPILLQKSPGAHAAQCREAVAVGLAQSDPAARVCAVRLALHPDVNLQAELRPLLTAPEAEVRRAVLFAAASATDGELVVGDEELFQLLHDPDEGVRKVCRDALLGRDRSDTEIALGRRLVDPDAGERLNLLLDLRYDDAVADPEPWLERLSRDPEPAVRAGAARVAAELNAARRTSCPLWVARVADADPDLTVRRVVGYFQRLPLRTAGGVVRPAVGP